MPLQPPSRLGGPAARPARATIGDVAAAAGVSKATVSRFLNHRDTLLTAEIAAKVEAAVKALGYTPSPMAQALKRGRSRLIGLVVADVSNPYSVAVLRGAERACQEAGYLLMLFNLANQSEREREAMEVLSSYQVEGFILNTLGADAGAAAEAARQGKPVVLVDRRHSGMEADLVALDNQAAARCVVDHLVQEGWRELLYVTEPMLGVSSRTEREAAFRACVADTVPRSAPGADALASTTLESLDGAPHEPSAALVEALQALRHRAGGRPAAVVSSNAVITLRLTAAMAALGWAWGRELGFVGFDDPEWAPYVGPGLTTIAQPTDALGQEAARCLIQRLRGLTPAPRQILLPGTLQVRGSSRRP